MMRAGDARAAAGRSDVALVALYATGTVLGMAVALRRLRRMLERFGRAQAATMRLAVAEANYMDDPANKAAYDAAVTLWEKSLL